MKKLILVDGNNLMFRSYFATAYSGSILKNSKGVPTNALYGFTSMINKIIGKKIIHKSKMMKIEFSVLIFYFFMIDNPFF